MQIDAQPSIPFLLLFFEVFFASFVALLWLMFEMFAHIICSVCVGMTCFIFCLAKGHFLTRVSCFVFFICHVSEVKSREHMHVSYAYMLYLKITPIFQFFFSFSPTHFQGTLEMKNRWAIRGRVFEYDFLHIYNHYYDTIALEHEIWPVQTTTCDIVNDM